MLKKRGAPDQTPINNQHLPDFSGTPTTNRVNSTVNSLDSKVANAPKRIKNQPVFVLGDPNSANLMEDFLKQSKTFDIYFPEKKNKQIDSNLD